MIGRVHLDSSRLDLLTCIELSQSFYLWRECVGRVTLAVVSVWSDHQRESNLDHEAASELTAVVLTSCLKFIQVLTASWTLDERIVFKFLWFLFIEFCGTMNTCKKHEYFCRCCKMYVSWLKCKQNGREWELPTPTGYGSIRSLMCRVMYSIIDHHGYQKCTKWTTVLSYSMLGGYWGKTVNCKALGYIF